MTVPTPAGGSILGTRVSRVEDRDLLVGAGTFVANQRPPGLLRAVFVRSPFGHANVKAVVTASAAEAPGVVAVLTGPDLGVAPFHGMMVLHPDCARPPLALDKVRFVGEPVAMVIAESVAQAMDAAELVEVDYEPLPVVADPEAALEPEAPLQFEALGSNVVAGTADVELGDPLAGAFHVARVRVQNQRVAVVPMEGNAICALPGPDDGVTIFVSTQLPHTFADTMARILDMAREDIRVVAPHVGGAFGGKPGVIAEHASVVVAARRLGRPVSWIETRSENVMGMHGRDQVAYVQVGFDEDARITGMWVQVVANAGAYAGFGGALAIGPTRMMAQGVYEIPAIRYDVVSVLTNTAPLGAFRGAGRPEATELLERVMDVAAAELHFDPVELRRRNLISRDAFPYTTRMGTVYDTGDYLSALDEAVRLADYPRLRAEQARRRERGDRRLLGIGVSAYVEVTAGRGGKEFGALRVDTEGTATIRVGTSGHGQGHATSFAMIVADRLGIPLQSIRLVQSDTDAVPRGGGTGGSRSLQLGGNAVRSATEQLWDRARVLAAAHLEADPSDICVVADGHLGVVGVPARGVSWGQLARLADLEGRPLAEETDFEQANGTFPFGAHVAVVEVDAETGKVELLRHVALDDCGRVLNPVVVEGQQHGGIAQGVAQALWEQVVYDLEGNPLTTNLADYAMPSAAEFPRFETSTMETPTPLNPLGAKGVGESGTIGATPAVHNAVIDALSHLGVRHIDMPCTPERVWQAISGANGRDTTWKQPPAMFEHLPSSKVTERPEAADIDI